MIFDYSAELGAPYKNRIVINGDRLSTEFADESYGCGETFFVVNLHSELSLCFAVDGGYLVGAQSGRLIFDNFSREEIRIPPYVEGRLRAVSGGNLLLAGCGYLDFAYDSVTYDEDNKLIAFGDPSEASVTVRVCANLFVSLNESGALASVIVSL